MRGSFRTGSARHGPDLGLRYAVVAMAGLFFVGLVLIALAPEMRGQNLPE
jgi:hypothetical protein